MAAIVCCSEGCVVVRRLSDLKRVFSNLSGECFFGSDLILSTAARWTRFNRPVRFRRLDGREGERKRIRRTGMSRGV